MSANYREEFIQFLLDAGALTFGEFKLKSGRLAPYFINMGNFNDGERIVKLGRFYAQHIMNLHPDGIDSLFGPAYKGIPLAVTAASSLFRDFSRNIGYTFNRKEEKDHGDGGTLVGRKLSKGDKILIIEDVITAGTTLQQTLPVMNAWGVTVVGVIIAVDRRERGSGSRAAIDEIQDQYKVPISPLITVHDIIGFLEKNRTSSAVVTPNLIDRMNGYLREHGPTE